MNQSRLLTGVVLASIVLAGCQFGSAQPTARPPAVTGWLSARADGVAFLNWTAAGSAISGTMTLVFVNGTADHLPKTTLANVTGTISSPAVTVTLSDSPTGMVTWSGQVSADSLTFAVPQAGGAIGTLTFGPGTLDDYNAALVLLKAKQAELHKVDLDAEAAAAAAASAAATATEAAATSCSATISSHNATLVVSGAPGAVGECQSFMAQVSFTGVPWLGPVYPSTTSQGSLICSGVRASYLVKIFDTGGADYGTAVCKALALASTIPYLGICFEDDISIGEGPIGLRIIPCGTGPGVVPRSPAALAGLREDDVIIELDGHKAPDHFTFDDIINPHQVGDTIAVVVLRGTTKLPLLLTLGPRPWA